MGMYHSAYFAYGIQIPDTDHEVLEEKLKGIDGEVGFLHAGDYDRDMTFLVTKCEEVSLGNYEVVTPQTATVAQYEAWGGQIREVAAALGLDEIPEPGWLLIPDLS